MSSDHVLCGGVFSPSLQTIENVLAQGGYLARRKFCTFEIAFRLLELSQHSRNTSIQVSSLVVFIVQLLLWYE
jgi:hypothetical protein